MPSPSSSIMNPCPCGSLQTGARVVAIFDIVLNSVGVALGILILRYIISNDYNMNSMDDFMGTTDQFRKMVEEGGGGGGLGDKSESDDPIEVSLSVVVLYLFYMIVELCAAVVLLIGASQRNLQYCQVWLVFSIFNLLVKGLNFVYSVALDKETLESAGSSFFEPLIRLFMMWVIYSFIKELKLEIRNKNINVYFVVCDQTV